MNSYKLLFDWQISMPDNWQGEYDKESGQYIFYPDNSDLTIRITPFHAERDGILAPREVMEDAYIRTVPVSARQRNLDFYIPSGFEAKIYDDVLTEDSKTNWDVIWDQTANKEVAATQEVTLDEKITEKKYSYVKVTFGDLVKDAWPAVAEFNVYRPKELTNFALDGEATASTQSRDPANALDGNDSTLWVGDGYSEKEGAWWMVDLGKFQQIQAFDLVFEYEVLPTLEDAQAATTPVYGQAWQYKIEGSNDKSSWDMLWDNTANTDFSKEQYADNGGMGVGAFTTAFTDSFVYNIYVADDNKVISSRNGVTETYGNENVRNDYHYLTTGEHASYTRANFLADLKSVMESVNPTDVYMTSRYDMHYDHAYFGLFGIEAIKDIQAENNDFQPTVHEAIIHSHMTDEVYPKDQGNYGWNHELDTYLGAWQHLDGLEEKTMLNWSERENVLTPYSMRQGPFKYNLKDQALRKYSTEYYNWIASFSKVNEVFYKHETNSIGSLATVTASSENSSDSRWDDQSVVKAVDGVADGYATGLANLHTRFPWAEWATKNEGAGAWLSLAYDEVQKVTKIKIYDRPNTDDHITNSHLEFDDGTTLEVGELPNDGSVKEISLGEGKEVKNIKFVVDEVSESTTAVGLAEIEVIK